MITDRDLVLASAAAYGSSPPTFSGLGGTARVFRTVVGDVAIYAFEGTHDKLGWLLDALALPLPSQLLGDAPDHIMAAIRFMAAPEISHASVEHPDIGFVHGGIYQVLMSVWPDCLAAIRSDIAAGLKIALTGHSLGGGEAIMATGLLVSLGIIPVRVAFFAPPRVGFKKLHDLVDRVENNSAWRYGRDPVPEVPWRVKPFWLYLQRDLISGGVAALPPWDDHHIANYVALEAQVNPPREAAAV